MDNVKNSFENEHGSLPDGQPHISVEVRRNLVKLSRKLRTANDDDDACASILKLLKILGDYKESLKQELPTLHRHRDYVFAFGSEYS